MSRSSIVLLLALATLSAGCAKREPAVGEAGNRRASRSDLVPLIRRSLVAVGLSAPGEGEPKIRQRLGTGFIVDADCTVLTARHVVVDLDEGRLSVSGRSADGPDYTAIVDILRLDPRQDLALLSIPAVLDGEVRCEDLGAPLPLVPERVTTRFLGDPIVIVGFPYLGKMMRSERPIPVVRTGAVSAAGVRWTITDEGAVFEDAPMILLDMIAVPGFSGSPVVLVEERQVIGVLLGAGLTPQAAGFVWASAVSVPELEAMKAAAVPRSEAAPQRGEPLLLHGDATALAPANDPQGASPTTSLFAMVGVCSPTGSGWHVVWHPNLEGVDPTVARRVWDQLGTPDFEACLRKIIESDPATSAAANRLPRLDLNVEFDLEEAGKIARTIQERWRAFGVEQAIEEVAELGHRGEKVTEVLTACAGIGAPTP